MQTSLPMISIFLQRFCPLKIIFFFVKYVKTIKKLKIKLHAIIFDSLYIENSHETYDIIATIMSIFLCIFLLLVDCELKIAC